MRSIVVLPALVAALALVPSAAAVGPSLPAVVGGSGILSASGDVSYVAHLDGASTNLIKRVHGETVQTASLPGSWGIQLATLDGALSGLSANGHVLVLSDNVNATGSLRALTRFAVVDTRTLAVTKTIALHGDFSVDVLSPNADTLYLIQHVVRSDLTKYKVRAYDLRAGLLVPGVIADKSQAGWLMAGYPLTRATSSTGRWVYTLYRQDNNYPFVHALDTVHHYAVCVGLPVDWTTDKSWLTTAQLKLAGGKLVIRANGGAVRLILDTTTFRVSTR